MTRLAEIFRVGGCQCGAVRYALHAAPLTLYACHCLDCQKQSASGFGMSMPVPRAGFALTRGAVQVWRRGAASGRLVDCAFCGTCGTRLYHAPARDPAIVNVKPGTLDVSDDLAPVGHVWVRRARPWLRPALDGILVDGQPDDFAPFHAAWAARMAAA
jgi:hypothetical protein